MAENEIEVSLITQPRHVFYFTGILPGGSPSFLLVSLNRLSMIAPIESEEYETVKYLDYDIWNECDVQKNIVAAIQLGLVIHGSKASSLGIEKSNIPGYIWSSLDVEPNRTADIDLLLWNIRKIKDDLEIAQIETNVQINDRIFTHLHQFLHPGVSELDVWSSIHQFMRRESGEWFKLEGDLGAGVRGADLGAQPGNATLEKGDCVFIDIYSSMHGYYADTTRVFAIGKPTQKQINIHKIIEEALLAGEQALRPGVPASEIDRIVRKSIEKSGFGENFPHHTGHAYGLFQQEKPFIIPADHTILEKGMILTIEPGIYLHDWGGMRIESNYLLTESGNRMLDRYPRNLSICGN